MSNRNWSRYIYRTDNSTVSHTFSQELKWRWSKKPKVGNRIMEITDALFKGRRELIQFKQPSVNDLLELFPSLESAKIVS